MNKNDIITVPAQWKTPYRTMRVVNKDNADRSFQVVYPKRKQGVVVLSRARDGSDRVLIGYYPHGRVDQIASYLQSPGTYKDRSILKDRKFKSCSLTHPTLDDVLERLE